MRMRRFPALVALVLLGSALGGCGTIRGWIDSKYDKTFAGIYIDGYRIGHDGVEPHPDPQPRVGAPAPDMSSMGRGIVWFISILDLPLSLALDLGLLPAAVVVDLASTDEKP
ncbi:MAG: hypothetical protein HY293_01785 [Planctomycetes bacterium]|nr:hypothetical protein [Planctomycetota bacterium]